MRLRLRVRRRWMWLGASLIVIAACTLAVLPELVRRVAMRQIRVATNRDVAIKNVELNLFTGTLAVKAFRLANRERSEPFIEFERMRARVRLLPLFAGRLHLTELTLERPRVHVIRTGPATFNFSDLLGPSAAAKPANRRAVNVTIEHFRLVDGTLLADDHAVVPARAWKGEDLSVDARDLSTRGAGDGGTVAVSLKVGATPISVKAESVRLAPASARATVTVQGFDLALLLSYLPHDMPGTLQSGRLSTTLTLDYAEARTRVDVDARLDQLVVRRQGQASPFASFPSLTIAVRDAEARDGRVSAKRIEIAGDAAVLDASVSPPARLDLTPIRVALEDVEWPVHGAVPIQLIAGLPKGGHLDARGTVGLSPMRADLRVVFRGIDLATFQPYLPVTAVITGKAQGDLAVTAAMGRELTATARGKAAVSKLSVGDGHRPSVEVERADVTGIDVAWPTDLTVARVLVHKPVAVIERNEGGRLPLLALLAPRRTEARPDTTATSASPDGTTAAPAKTPRKTMVIEIAEIVVEDGNARFVDHGTTPPYSEEMSNIAVSLKGVSNAPGKRAHLVVQGVVGGTSALDLHGDVTPLGETLSIDLTGELRDFRIAQVNSFLDRLIAWIAREGRLTMKVHYRIEGDRLEATNEIVIGRLEMTRAGEQDEVKRRLGLPLGLIVALMKDSHGDIRVSVPVSGRLGTPEFSFREAIWAAVQNVVVKVLTAPFKLIGKLFTKGDTIETLAIDPARFEPGSAAVGPATGEHLQRVAEFLKASPFVRVTLAPVTTGSDVSSLKTQEVTARIQGLQREEGIAEFSVAAARVFKEQFPDDKAPKTVQEMVGILRDRAPEPEADARALATRRLDATREALRSAADIPADRLITGDLVTRPSEPEGGSVAFSITP